MNGSEQKTKAYVSPLPTNVMTDQPHVYTKYQIQVVRKYMDVNYDLLLIDWLRFWFVSLKLVLKQVLVSTRFTAKKQMNSLISE